MLLLRCRTDAARWGLLTDAVTEGVRQATAFLTSGSKTEPDTAPGRPWEAIGRVRERDGTVVATGGCFDLLHPGHVSLLRQARALGDHLVVCLNSDLSVRALKDRGAGPLVCTSHLGTARPRTGDLGKPQSSTPTCVQDLTQHREERVSQNSRVVGRSSPGP